MNLKNIDIHILKILMCNKKITLKEIINIESGHIKQGILLLVQQLLRNKDYMEIKRPILQLVVILKSMLTKLEMANILRELQL